ncbi:hypothetical protein ACVPOQ_01460 [Staphylococcus aureus]
MAVTIGEERITIEDVCGHLFFRKAF